MTIAEAIVNLAQQGFLDRLEESTPEEKEEGMRIGEATLERYRSVTMTTRPFEDVLGEWAEQDTTVPASGSSESYRIVSRNRTDPFSHIRAMMTGTRKPWSL